VALSGTVLLRDEHSSGVDDDSISTNPHDVKLMKKDLFIYDTPCPDAKDAVRWLDGAWNLTQYEFSSADGHGMPGVRTSTANEKGKLRVAGKKCCDFAFALRPVLTSNDDCDRHNFLKH
jgi:hypothetical protein